MATFRIGGTGGLYPELAALACMVPMCGFPNI